MKNIRCCVAVVLMSILFVAINALAVDYTVFSNQELFAMKNAVSSASAAEQETYQQEWQARLDSMSEEERKVYTEPAEEKGKSGERIPVVIQAQGYEKQGTGTVIYGGMPSGKGARKSGGK